jgi:DUF4097 and DUF4098 domain-containing protein YvlB
LNSASITICTKSYTLSAEDFKIDDFVLYPNRIRILLFNLRVNLKLIKVLVHDLLGRKLFDKTMRVIVTSIKHSVAAIANRDLFVNC